MPRVGNSIGDPRREKRMCQKCGQKHFSSVTCEYGAIINERDRQREIEADRRRVKPVFKTRVEQEPGDRMLTVRRVANNVFVQPGGRDV